MWSPYGVWNVSEITQRRTAATESPGAFVGHYIVVGSVVTLAAPKIPTSKPVIHVSLRVHKSDPSLL